MCMYDARASWEVLREVIGRGRGKRGGAPCGYFERGGEGVTDKGEIAAGFCDFFTEVGPRLAAGVRRERAGAFRGYLGDRVSGSLFMRPTTPQEVVVVVVYPSREDPA